MFRRIFAAIGFPTLAAMGSLLVAEPAAAQQGQNLYEWSGHWGRSSDMPSYPSGYYGGYPAAEQNSYRGYYGAYAPSGGYYDSEPSADQAVHIAVRVPRNAEIWFDGQKTQETGAFREFISPPLSPDRAYRYEVRARWTERGQTMDRTRRITVHPGDWIRLDFASGQPANKTP